MKFDELDRAILAHFSPGFGGTEIPDWLYPWLENGLGGLTLFSSNCPSIDQTALLIEKIRAISPNIVISIDEEGGDVTRLFVTEGSPFPTPALLGRCDDLKLTHDSFFELGKILKSIGIDLNLAPVADVSVMTENPIVGVRAFSDDVSIVERHIPEAVNGLQRAGVAACVKHFPGHGGVVEDSHHQLPKLPGTKEELEHTHVRPFKAAIASNVASVMTGHIVIPSLDPIDPASCSEKVTRQYLRNELGFSGLVVTDALDMGALGGPKKIHQSALRALKAGADILCFSGLYDQSVFIETSFNTIKDALSTGTLGAEEILANGTRLNSWKRPVSQGSSMPQQIATERFQKGLEIRGDIRLLGESIQLIELSADPTIAAGFVGWGLRRSLTHAGIKVKLESSDVSLDGPESGQVIVAFRDAFRDSKILAALERIYRQRPDTIFVDMGWPTRRFTPANIIRTFGSSALASELAVAAITNRD